MKHSEHLDKIIPALAAFQAVVTPPPKNRTVTVKQKDGGMYSFSYAELHTILEHIKKPFGENGFAWNATVDLADPRQPILITRLYHISGQWFEFPWRMVPHQDPKGFAGELTYGKRYSLSALLGIATEDDAENVPNEKDRQGDRGRQQQQQRPPQQNQQRGPAPGERQPPVNPVQPKGQAAGANAPAIGAGTPAGKTAGAGGNPASPEAGPQAQRPNAPAGPASNASAGPAGEWHPGPKDLESLVAMASDKSRVNQWPAARLTEFMQKRFKKERLGLLTKAEYDELFATVRDKTLSAAFDELADPSTEQMDFQGDDPDGDPKTE